MKLRVVNIQRFSVYDGPGIRTTIFTQGCSIRCPWCANPETWVTNNKVKKHWKIKDYNVKELAEYCLRDKEFYGSDGGVTVSGGEALLQAEALVELFRLMHNNDINCCVETALYVPLVNIQKVISYIDYLYIDIKVLNDQSANDTYGGSVSQYLKNLDYLKKNFDSQKIIFRLPLVKGFTDSQDNLERCLTILQEFKPKCFEIFNVHNLGKSKYEKLEIPFIEYEKVSEERLEEIKSFFEENGINVKINR